MEQPLIKIQSILKKKSVIILLLSSFFFNAPMLKSQNFYFWDSLIVPIPIDVSLDAVSYIQQKINDNIVYNIHSSDIYNDKNAIYFFTYDPLTHNFNWNNLRVHLPSYDDIRDFVLFKNQIFAADGYDKLLIFKKSKKNNYFKLRKKVKLIDFDKVFVCNDNFLFLTRDYNYVSADKKKPWAEININLYNIKKKKIDKRLNYDIGKIINLSHFWLSFETMATNRNGLIALSDRGKYQVNLYDDNLKLFKTISSSCIQKYNLDSIFDVYLPDDFLNQNRFNPGNRMKIMMNNKLHQYPMINRINFVDSNSLLIVYNPDTSTYKTERDVYVYSLLLDSVVKVIHAKKSDKNIPTSMFNYTGRFYSVNDGIYSYLDLQFDSIHKRLQPILKMWVFGNDVLLKSKLPKLFNLEGKQVMTDSLQQRFVFIDDKTPFCTHCFDKYKETNVLVLTPFHNDITNRYSNLQFLKTIFPESTILFYQVKPFIDKTEMHKVLYFISD